MSQERMVKVYRSKDGKPIRFIKFPERNEKCPCLSGKKFKHCHIDKKDELIEIVKQIHETLKKQADESKTND